MTYDNFEGDQVNRNIGSNRSNNIHGIVQLSPPAAEIAVHTQYLGRFSDGLKENFEEGQRMFRERAKLFLQLVDQDNLMIQSIPDEAYRIYISEDDPESLARASYDTAGNAYVSMDVKDIQKSSPEEIAHFCMHEFMHIIGYHEVSSISTQDAEKKRSPK
jgi:hypothetical protein